MSGLNAQVIMNVNSFKLDILPRNRLRRVECLVCYSMPTDLKHAVTMFYGLAEGGGGGRGGEFLLDLPFRPSQPPPATSQAEEQEDDHDDHSDEDAFWLHA